MRKELRIRGQVKLLTSARVLTPMTGGLWKPVILLPESAALNGAPISATSS